MISLFPHTTPVAAQQETEPSKPSLFSQIGQTAILGGSLFGGGSIAWMAIELLKDEPDKGFKLLQAWGPWCFLAVLTVIVVNGWITKLMASRDKADDRMTTVLDRLAAGQERIAAAAEAAAGKDDRAAQQQEILLSTVVMQSKRLLRKMHAQDRALERVEDKLGINRPTPEPGDEEID